MKTPVTYSFPFPADTPVNNRQGFTVELLEFEPPASVTRMIVSKGRDCLSLATFEVESVFEETTSCCEIFVQVINGEADLRISDYVYKLRCGEGVMIPGRMAYKFAAYATCRVLFTRVTMDSLT
jgi:hypothetical protein